MGIISFSVFKDKILDGAKAHTIRERKIPPIVGETLYLWWKPRTKDKEFLGVTICTQVDLIQINSEIPSVQINDRKLDYRKVAKLAQSDGFQDAREFWQFFDKSLQGYLIHWNPNFINRSQLRPEVLDHGGLVDEVVHKPIKIFNPSNGTEGMDFSAHWCDKCDRDKEGQDCPILIQALIDKTPHWILHEGRGVCTSFVSAKRTSRSSVEQARKRSLERKGQLNLLNQNAN